LITASVPTVWLGFQLEETKAVCIKDSRRGLSRRTGLDTPALWGPASGLAERTL